MALSDFNAKRQRSMIEMYARAYGAVPADVARPRRGTPQQRRLTRLHRMQAQRKAKKSCLLKSLRTVATFVRSVLT